MNTMKNRIIDTQWYSFSFDSEQKSFDSLPPKGGDANCILKLLH